jgi:hypothetical protein
MGLKTGLLQVLRCNPVILEQAGIAGAPVGHGRTQSLSNILCDAVQSLGEAPTSLIRPSGPFSRKREKGASESLPLAGEGHLNFRLGIPTGKAEIVLSERR